MKTRDEIMYLLKRPFEEKQISWRVGSTNSDKTSGIALAYIDARDVMHRLDSVFGLDWQCKYTHAETKTICEIGVKIESEWIWRAGGAGDSDIEAEKGAISDAFKRAAVLFGIGQYLYSLPNQWFDITPAGKSYKLAGTPTLPKWATPEGYDAIMEKRARVTEPAKGVTKDHWDTLPEADQRRIQGVADTVRASLDAGDMETVMVALSEVSEVEEKTALWSRLDSKERSAIKKYQQTKEGK